MHQAISIRPHLPLFFCCLHQEVLPTRPPKLHLKLQIMNVFLRWCTRPLSFIVNGGRILQQQQAHYVANRKSNWNQNSIPVQLPAAELDARHHARALLGTRCLRCLCGGTSFGGSTALSSGSGGGCCGGGGGSCGGGTTCFSFRSGSSSGGLGGTLALAALTGGWKKEDAKLGQRQPEGSN
jgi:hypothetical protein